MKSVESHTNVQSLENVSLSGASQWWFDCKQLEPPYIIVTDAIFVNSLPFSRKFETLKSTSKERRLTICIGAFQLTLRVTKVACYDSSLAILSLTISDHRTKYVLGGPYKEYAAHTTYQHLISTRAEGTSLAPGGKNFTVLKV